MTCASRPGRGATLRSEASDPHSNQQASCACICGSGWQVHRNRPPDFGAARGEFWTRSGDVHKTDADARSLVHNLGLQLGVVRKKFWVVRKFSLE